MSTEEKGYRFLETKGDNGEIVVTAVVYLGHLDREALAEAGKKHGHELTDAALNAAHHAEMSIEGVTQNVTVVPAGLI